MFGIVVKSSRAVSLFINNVEVPLGITLTIGTPYQTQYIILLSSIRLILGQTTTITVMCTTYGNTANPACKAYRGTTKTLPLTSVIVGGSVGGASTDVVMIGDTTCAFDGYIRQMAIAKDGNILDSIYRLF